MLGGETENAIWITTKKTVNSTMETVVQNLASSIV